MADIDVQAIGLASPPAAAFRTTYTPGIIVRNNGLAAVVATGYLQMYDKVSGVLVEQWPLSSGEISPGAEGTATSGAVIDWTEVDPGTQFIFSGLVTCTNDQVPSNNPLAPVTVTVQEGEPPEPPTVPAHAAQHEQGGSDQLDASNLSGKLSTPQTPETHAARHEDGGNDELELDGLRGTLADPQTPTAHANERHSVAFASNADLAEHEAGTTEHEAATNLEHVANKGAASGYAGLSEGGWVPPAQLGSNLSGETPSRLLREDNQWVDAPGAVADNTGGGGVFAPVVGSAETAARSDSAPRSSVCADNGGGSVTKIYNTSWPVIDTYIPATRSAGVVLSGQVYGRLFGSSARNIQVELYFDNTEGGNKLVLDTSNSTLPGLDGEDWGFEFMVNLDDPNVGAWGRLSTPKQGTAGGTIQDYVSDVFDQPAYNLPSTDDFNLRVLVTTDGDTNNYLKAVGFTVLVGNEG